MINPYVIYTFLSMNNINGSLTISYLTNRTFKIFFHARHDSLILVSTLL